MATELKVTDPVMCLLDELKDTELALKHRATFRTNYLYPAMDAGLIEMTLPEK